MGISQYYNKLIDVELIDTVRKSSTFIRCPTKGVKPQIEISGTIESNDVVNAFEVRITNFYPDDVTRDYQQIRVYAGYENDKSVVFEGSIVAMYTETPGPDRVTVIYCNTANMAAWSDAAVQLSLDPGFSLTQAVTKIAQALKYDYQIDLKANAALSKIRWDFNGSARQAITELENFFPEFKLVVANNRITVLSDSSVKRTFRLPYLKTPAQFGGQGCTLVAPWNPNIKPGDFVTFPTGTYKISEGAIKMTKVNVHILSFNFDTAGNANTMTIMGGTELK